jgi:CBS domain-containing protein
MSGVWRAQVKVPTAVVPLSGIVMDAMKKMQDNDVGAVVILDSGRLQGIYA